MNDTTYNAIDLFAGCGGLSEGLKQAGFFVKAGIEINRHAANVYRLNHPESILFEEDIAKFDSNEILNLLDKEKLHLLAGCPPCQGFSSIRRRNKRRAVRDKRNSLILEYFRLVQELQPMTIMLENVPGIVNYTLFKRIVRNLKKLGYFISYEAVDISHYEVPQRRKRLVLVGSKLCPINISAGTGKRVTVRKAFEALQAQAENDPARDIYPTHTERIRKMISLIPKDGGSRADLPPEYTLECHKKENVGFNDVYGRLSWDSVSSTITGGCLNPSKGRFLHPEKNRCISVREAALLQTFPTGYKFPIDIPKSDLALLIGNALPPAFSRIQATSILKHLQLHSA